MSFKSQLLIFTAGFVLCLAIVLPFVWKVNIKEVIESPNHMHKDDHRHGSPPVPPKPSRGSKPDFQSTKASKKGWATTLAPIYTIGICVYVLYIVHRILSPRKRNAGMQLANSQRKGRTLKDNVGAEELSKLEEKVVASEKAVEEILRKARTAMVKSYQEDSDDSSSLSDTSSSSNDQAKIRELSEGTTSSANDDFHQDSSSSTAEKIPLHHRKTHHRPRKSFETDDSSSTASEAESGIYHGTSFGVTDLSYPNADDNEDIISTNHEHSEFQSENDLTHDQTNGKLDVAHRIGGSNDETCMQQSTSAETMRGTVEEGGELKDVKSKHFLEEEELLRTSREVLTAVEEIKDFIKDQKEENLS